MQIIKQVLQSDPTYKALMETSARAKLPIIVSGAVDGLSVAAIASALSGRSPRKGIIIAPDEKMAYSIKNALDCYMSGVCVFPARDFVFNHIDSASHEWEHERLRVLGQIRRGEFSAVVATADAALQLTLPMARLEELSITLTVGQDFPPEKLCALLAQSGYIRADIVEGQGQFTQRGGIVDIYCPSHEDPLRIEFYGDEVDSLSFFDVTTQRRADTLPEVRIVPCTEIVPTPEARASAAKAAQKLAKACEDPKGRARLAQESEKLENSVEFAGIDKYIAHIYPHAECLFDYMSYLEDVPYLFVMESARVVERVKSSEGLLEESVKMMLEQGQIDGKSAVYSRTSDDFGVYMSTYPCIIMDAFVSGRLTGNAGTAGIFNFNSKQAGFNPAALDVLKDDLANLVEADYKIIIVARSRSGADYIREYLSTVQDEEDNRDTALSCAVVNSDALEWSKLENGYIYITTGDITGGFELASAKFALFCEGTAPALRKRGGRSNQRKDVQKILSYAELAVGDFIVHTNYGIGVFDGTECIESFGVRKDYIKIKYAGSDVLYVPCNQLDMVAKYIGAGAESGNVRLSKMGGEAWHKAKAKVKSAAKDMARQLIKLYAARAARQGFAFSPDGPWQQDFEAMFEYEETDDQLRSIVEIKRDMQKQTPMDRLLCGDVGFGKTEVALRAAFKAVSDSKQVAILVPTTILAWQHYQTILQRFREFPVTVDLLSRFRNPKQQKQTLKKLTTGEVDIVVGTHRVIQKDIKFKDLGLLVVDEEQRFGVGHKERLKEMSADVDVLTLTATPIPRTLNMALAGIRDMSVLDEAPHDRSPVQTYVFEYDEGLIFEGIRRELRRAGQVFYLHNRVETISSCAGKISRAFPDANVGVAHGQMDEEELSDVWRALLEHQIDILVCTTIIETGVDVSNANTLIIEEADRLGLSQLHQIRGRVGRSSRKAYAYLTYPRSKILSEIATKRLMAIREFTEFGSGFKIAMRDLEIRGAGNILGAEQHGHMDAVGYDMYIRLLERAIKEEQSADKGTPEPVRTECTVDIAVDAFIPHSYISVDRQRIDVYKKIAAIGSEDDMRDVLDELLDRFGEIPRSVDNLINIALLRNTACMAGIKNIETRDKNIVIYPEQIDLRAWSECMSEFKGAMLLSMGASPYITVRMGQNQRPLDLLREILNVYTQKANKK